MKIFFTVLFLVFSLLPPAFSPVFAKEVVTKTGLKYEDTKPGTGPTASAGKTVAVHYTGWLYANGKRGKKFDSSLEIKEPLVFKLGSKQVIA
ncbi:MAG: FKBP-type peptidyl-prolyl cis-trans isomerase, partial [bacterium]|nr:FKBP-type peptidyl-prolyl cis-trans isomerase [bacterium]